jgi:hypothetical protein
VYKQYKQRITVSISSSVESMWDTTLLYCVNGGHDTFEDIKVCLEVNGVKSGVNDWSMTKKLRKTGNCRVNNWNIGMTYRYTIYINTRQPKFCSIQKRLSGMVVMP